MEQGHQIESENTQATQNIQIIYENDEENCIFTVLEVIPLTAIAPGYILVDDDYETQSDTHSGLFIPDEIDENHSTSQTDIPLSHLDKEDQNNNSLLTCNGDDINNADNGEDETDCEFDPDQVIDRLCKKQPPSKGHESNTDFSEIPTPISDEELYSVQTFQEDTDLHLDTNSEAVVPYIHVNDMWLLQDAAACDQNVKDDIKTNENQPSPVNEFSEESMHFEQGTYSEAEVPQIQVNDMWLLKSADALDQNAKDTNKNPSSFVNAEESLYFEEDAKVEVIAPIYDGLSLLETLENYPYSEHDINVVPEQIQDKTQDTKPEVMLPKIRVKDISLLQNPVANFDLNSMNIKTEESIYMKQGCQESSSSFETDSGSASIQNMDVDDDDDDDCVIIGEYKRPSVIQETSKYVQALVKSDYYEDVSEDEEEHEDSYTHYTCQDPMCRCKNESNILQLCFRKNDA